MTIYSISAIFIHRSVERNVERNVLWVFAVDIIDINSGIFINTYFIITIIIVHTLIYFIILRLNKLC
jgi:hypothetical protein